MNHWQVRVSPQQIIDSNNKYSIGWLVINVKIDLMGGVLNLTSLTGWCFSYLSSKSHLYFITLFDLLYSYYTLIYMCVFIYLLLWNPKEHKKSIFLKKKFHGQVLKGLKK